MAHFPIKLLERVSQYERVELPPNLNYSEFVQWIVHQSRGPHDK